MEGKIYALVGPNGGGKSYKQKELMLATDNDVKFITADFSDGIRNLICRMYTGEKDWEVDVLSENYAIWKDKVRSYYLPDFCCWANGRQIMQNLGEAVKDIYPDFWAKYTGNMVFNKLNELSDEERNTAVICFGSVRFQAEIEVVEYMANVFDKKLEFIFCNYNNAVYREEVHASEMLGNKLIRLGYKHNDIIKMEDLL